MQIREDVYNWLVNLKIIANDGKKFLDKVEISKAVVGGFENGILFSKLLQELYKLKSKANNRPETPLTKLDTLKEVNSAASRLYNWQILVEEYQKVGIRIDQDTKGLILSGDIEMIHELLKEIYTTSAAWGSNTLRVSQSSVDLGMSKFEDSMSILNSGGNNKSTKSIAQIKLNQAHQQVDLSKLDAKKDLNRTHNCLEFFIVALSKHLQLQTKQAATLFTNNNKYLAHVLAKGVKGVFEPIVSFYQEVFANSNQLMKLFIEDQTKKSLVFTLQALKAGLVSKSFEVAQWTARLYAKLAQDFVENNQILLAWDWFVNEDGGGLYTALMGLKRHPDLREVVVNMILQFARFNFVEVFTNGLRKALPETKDLINSIEQLFKPLADHKLSMDELLNSGILDEWVDLSLQTAEGEFKNPVDVRISALSFVCEVWVTFPQKIEESEIKANTLISLLKRGSRDKSQSLTLTSLNNLFKLLSNFGHNKNPYAPIIYKNLSLSLIENHSNSVAREFILQNFISCFQQLETIPFNIIVEPLVKQVQVSENVTYILNTFDMMFFHFLAGTDRLGIKNAIQLLDLLAKVFLNNTVFAAQAQDIIVTILSKHIENPTMQEFILKFIKIALAMFYASEKKKKPKDKYQQITSKGIKSSDMGQSAIGNQELEQEVISAQRRAQIVEIIRTIVQLQQGILNDKIKPLIAHTNIQIKQFSKKNSKGMLVILTLFGNPDKILEQYEIEFREHQARLQMDAQQEEDEQAVSAVYEQNQSMKSVEESMKKYGIGIKGKTSKLSKEEQYHLASLRQSKADPKVLVQLENIKQSFMEKVHTKVQAAEEQKEYTEKTKIHLRKQLEKRSIEQGISNKNQKDQEAKLLYKDGAREKDLMKEKKHGLPEFDLLDLELEEERDKFTVDMVLRKYHKILKYQFLKYANTGHTNKKHANFEQYADKADSISVSELWQFIKDYQLETQVKKEEIPALIRMVQLNIVGDKTEVTSLYYSGFKHFLVQFSIIVYGRTERNNQKYLQPSVTLQKLITHMRTITAAKDQTTQLFDDPENQYFQETEVIKDYNKKLQQDPKFILPEGYKTVQEPTIDFKYLLLDKLPLKESQKAAYETVNDILQSIFQFNLIEPTTTKDSITLCRPNMLGYVKSKVADRIKGGPLYLEYEKTREQKEAEQKKLQDDEEKKRLEYEKMIRDRKKVREDLKKQGKKEKVEPKYTKQLLDRFTQSAGVTEVQPKHRTLEIDAFHQPTFGMRLGISNVHFLDRGIAEQVALVIDDMLFAVETNKKTISRKIPVPNKVIGEKDKEQERLALEEEKKNEKYKKDQQMMKDYKENLKQKKEEEKKNKEPEESKKKEEENKKVEKKVEKRKKYISTVKEAATENQKKTEEERIKKEQIEQARRIEELQKKKIEFNKFNQQKIQKFKEEQELEKKVKQDQEMKEKQKEEKNKLIAQKLFEVIEKKGEKILGLEQKTKEKITSRFKSNEYQAIFEKNNFKLSYLYELLQLEFYKPIEYADNKDFIPLKIWMWIGERFNIFPEIMKQVDFVRMFTSITHKKSKDPKSKAPIGINYHEFLECLLRISIKGFTVFDRIAQKLKANEKLSNEQMKEIVDEEQKKEQEEEKKEEKKEEEESPQKEQKRMHQTKEYMKKEIKKELDNHKQRLEDEQKKNLEIKKIEKQALLIDNYKFVNQANESTLNAFIYYLGLPEDKIGIELRFRMLMEDSTKHPSDKQRKQELLSKLDEDLETWKIEAKLAQRTAPVKTKKKPQKLFDPYAPKEKKSEHQQQQELGIDGDNQDGENHEGDKDENENKEDEENKKDDNPSDG